MIGYYVHHQGQGHASRATAIAAAFPGEVVGLSSRPRPREWSGEWMLLPRDDAGGRPLDPTAGGRLHWAPLGDPGLRARMAAISAWIARAEPAALVVDISVEVVALARLHGVPVATFALPGLRDDAPHRLGYDLSSLILAAWPPGIAPLARGLTPTSLAKLQPVGAISRFAPHPDAAAQHPASPALHGSAGTTPFPPLGPTTPVGSAPGPLETTTPNGGRVLLLAGAGGDDFDEAALDAARRATPAWHWTVLGGSTGRWTDDPWPHLLAADVVITHAGQNALAEVAAARRPAIVIPQPRPHDEQLTTARALAAAGFPLLVLDRFASPGAPHNWPALLDRTRHLPTDLWATWNDGLGATRAAHALAALARTPASPLGGANGSNSPPEPHIPLPTPLRADDLGVQE